MGGAGSTLSVKSKGDIREWCVTIAGRQCTGYRSQQKDANKY